MTIDAHQHFWHYHPVQHGWIDDEMQAIRRDFLPQDLEPVLHANGIDACVAVQADETEAETNFLIELASQHAFVKAIIGFVDLTKPNVDERLAYYKQFLTVKGFRHVLQGRDPSFMLQPSFLKGIAALKPYDFTYDILIFPKHLEAALELIAKNPEQRFVIDHIAKPYVKAGLIDEWKTGMQKTAAFENVFCKVSGMVTEADYQHWKPFDFYPYLDVVTEAFGTKRLLFGSDWPVCLVAAPYSKMKSIVSDYFASFSKNEVEDIFGHNAASFYNIEM